MFIWFYFLPYEDRTQNYDAEGHQETPATSFCLK